MKTNDETLESFKALLNTDDTELDELTLLLLERLWKKRRRMFLR